MAALTFNGFDESAGHILYRGGLGADYSFVPEKAAEVFKFPHGSRLQCRRGPLEARGPLVVIGTTNVARCELVVHDESNGFAFIIPGVHTFSDLSEKHDPMPVPAYDALPKAYVEMAGPLQFRYAFNTDSVQLEPKYGLSTGTRIHVGSLHDDATVVGEFLNVLWVTPAHRTGGGAVPLVGCINESSMLSLHDVRDSNAATGGVSPRTPRTPGRARGQAAPYKVEGRVATCIGPMGGNLEVSLDPEAFKPFGVSHGQRLVATKGLDVGKGFTVVGVKSGNLYLHGDGDRKVTCCRNCTTKADLEKLYGVGASSASITPRTAPAPETLPSPRAPRVDPSSPQRASSVDSSDAGSPPRSSATVKSCWTSYGRQRFDISVEACTPFGYLHGQTVKARRGAEAGRRFHVFGVRLGTLWVVPEGAEYATPLRHCSNKAELDKAFHFVADGKTTLEWLFDAPKPVSTPISSPRREVSNTSLDRADAYEMPPPQQQQQPAESSRNVAAVTPPVKAVARPAGLPVVPKLPISIVHEQSSARQGSGPVYVVAPDTSPATIPTSSYELDRSVDAVPFTVGAMPATRTYLKAFALFQNGLASEEQDPQAFHSYYAAAPQKRLSAALAALPSLESHWRQFEQRKRSVTFSNATVDEMLDAIRRAPHLCPAAAA